MIKVENVTKIYKVGGSPVNALKNVSMTIDNGEFLSIMGPSGSGKSTLLHLIGGLDRPTDGKIIVENLVLGELSDYDLTLYRRRDIGFVFQFFNLLPTLRAWENVAMPLLLDGKDPDEISGKVDELLKLVGLYQRRNHKPDEMSGGEMQRIALARALVTEPKMILADEPTGNLDSKTGTEILTLLQNTSKNLGKTVILVTHDDKAASYGRRLVRIKDGEIIEDRQQGK